MGRKRLYNPKRYHPNAIWRSRTYTSWAQMKNRCNNTRDPHYPHYGGSGIKVCLRWNASFLNFLADMGPRPPGTTLNRINPYDGYHPKNCEWATPKQQGDWRGKRRWGLLSRGRPSTRSIPEMPVYPGDQLDLFGPQKKFSEPE